MDFATEHGLSHGGPCPKGYADDGTMPMIG